MRLIFLPESQIGIEFEKLVELHLELRAFACTLRRRPEMSDRSHCCRGGDASKDADGTAEHWRTTSDELYA